MTTVVMNAKIRTEKISNGIKEKKKKLVTFQFPVQYEPLEVKMHSTPKTNAKAKNCKGKNQVGFLSGSILPLIAVARKHISIGAYTVIR